MPYLLTELVHLLMTPLAYVVMACLAGALSGNQQWRQAMPARYRRLMGAAGVVLYLWSVPALPSKLTAYTEGLHPVPDLTSLKAGAGHDPRVLVLSAGWFRQSPEGPRAMLGSEAWERTRAGVDAWRQLGGTLIFSGGPTPDGVDSVAAQMARAADAMGVPAARLLVEPASRNTRENLNFSARMLGLHAGEPVVLVTSALHMARSVELARVQGIAVLPYPCDWRGQTQSTWRDWLPSNSAPGAWQDVLHEWIGILGLRLGVAP
jgi:uncharacterized SAM-binding protein YcdF (DUF218 family)